MTASVRSRVLYDVELPRLGLTLDQHRATLAEELVGFATDLGGRVERVSVHRAVVRSPWATPLGADPRCPHSWLVLMDERDDVACTILTTFVCARCESSRTELRPVER